jgi:hypothetical protein
MQITSLAIRPSQGHPAPWHAPEPAQRRESSAAPTTGSDSGSDHDFVEMLAAFRSSGGLARAHEVLELPEGRGPGVATLARWIVERDVISFEWHSQTWLPWFQFKHPGRLPDPSVGAVLAALGAVRDDWAFALWLARPHPMLAGRTPVDAFAGAAEAVLQAARADGLGARG